MSVEVQQVSFTYHRHPVVSNLTLSLEAGHFDVVVGPNGAGKTTLLRLLSGLLEPDEGSIFLSGKTCGQAQKEGIVHLVPQIYNKNTAQFPATVGEVVELLLHLDTTISAQERHERRDMALSQVGMQEVVNRRMDSLSGGQQQRVMIAQALARKSSILLLDEPTSGIDFRAGEHILELLKTLAHEKQILIVMVTHDIMKAMKYADRVICINRDVCYYGDCEGFVETHLSTALAWHVGG